MAETFDIDDYLNSPPYGLFARRSVRNFYQLPHSWPAAKFLSALGFQMRATIQDLASELRKQGRDYDLLLQGGPEGKKGHWKLLLNGELFATIDRDYGFDCFDVSSTQFKDKIAGLIDQAEQRSKIHPLSERERKDLDARLMSEPMEWGRLRPDDKHGVGLGEEYLNQLAHRQKTSSSPRAGRAELQKFIDKYFKSPLIKQHLRNQEIDARTQVLLVFTADAPLVSKRYAFLRLVEEEERLIGVFEQQIENLPSDGADSASEREELSRKLHYCEEAASVFATYLELIDNAMHDLLYWWDTPASRRQGKHEDRKELVLERRCILCTYFKHNEGYESDWNLEPGVQFKNIGRFKISCEMDVQDPTALPDDSFSPSITVANQDNTAFAMYKPWNAAWGFPSNQEDDIEFDEGENFEFIYEDGTLKTFDGCEMSAAEIIGELMNCPPNDEEETDDGLVGYSGRKSALSFFSSNSLGEFVFGPEDEHLNSLKSLFVGVFEQGTFLTLDFEPFYKKREGIVLKPAYVYESAIGEDVVSEMVLTKAVASRWCCGELAGRYFFGGIDPLGPYFNSYSAVKESDRHNEAHEMTALEGLIGIFLDRAKNVCEDREIQQHLSVEKAAKEAEFYILEAVRTKLEEDPTLAERIIRAFDLSPQFGLTDEELLGLCGIDV